MLALKFAYLVDNGRAAIEAMTTAVRAARAFDGNFESLVHVVLPGLFGALMAYFGISSFLRARKISRS